MSRKQADISLTQRMIDDYAPHLKDPHEFAQNVLEDIEWTGPVIKIQDVYFQDGSLGEKRYFFEKIGTSSPGKVLEACRTYQSSLPPNPEAEKVYLT